MTATIKVHAMTTGKGYRSSGPGLNGHTKSASGATPLLAARRCALMMLGMPGVQSSEEDYDFEREHGISLRHLTSVDDTEIFELIATEPPEPAASE